MECFGYTLFDTALGCCGVAWGERGLRALQLPEGDTAATRQRLLRRAPGATAVAPSALARQAIDGVTALLAGAPAELSALPLDLRGVPELHARIYDLVRRIPRGRTLSYGQVAEQLGDRRLARAVGQAMARNPFAPVVPCHRVLGVHGQAGGFSARGGLRTKLLLLTLEQARLSAEPDLFADEPTSAQ
jgi:methylated-DNA-[protein]-cysteine S-methyltransferase